MSRIDGCNGSYTVTEDRVSVPFQKLYDPSRMGAEPHKTACVSFDPLMGMIDDYQRYASHVGCCTGTGGMRCWFLSAISCALMPSHMYCRPS